MSWVVPLLMASMTASVKSRPPSWPGSVQNLYWHQGLDPSPPVNPEDIDKLFVGDAAPDLQGDGEIAPYDVGSSSSSMRPIHLKGARWLRRRTEKPLLISRFFGCWMFSIYFLFFFFLNLWENNIYSFCHPLFLGFFGCKLLLFMGFLSIVFISVADIFCLQI